MNSYRVNFLLQYHSKEYVGGQFRTSRIVGESDSLRKAAISVIKEALDDGANIWADEASEGAHIAVYLANNKVHDLKTGFESSGFGIKYALRPDGSLVVLEGYSPLGHDWTFKELHELAKCEYVKGDPKEIILGLPDGLGAGGVGVLDFISFLADVLSIGVASASVLRKISSNLKYHNIRKITKQWKENNIDSPRQIREFLEVKGTWTLSEVKRRLKLDDEFAIKLLASLGMEADGNLWKPGYSDTAIKNHKKWIQLEEKYEKELAESNRLS